MSLKALFMGEMVQISTPWLTPEDAAYLVFQKTPQLAGLQPEMRKAHDAIFALRARSEDPRIQGLSDQATALDAKHDDQARGVHAALSMLAMVSKSSDTCLRLRDLLLPDGLQHLQRTYREEAGHAALVASKLDDKTKAELKANTVHDVNMLDMVQGWLDTAKQLGDVEETRVRLATRARARGPKSIRRGCAGSVRSMRFRPSPTWPIWTRKAIASCFRPCAPPSKPLTTVGAPRPRPMPVQRRQPRPRARAKARPGRHPRLSD